MLAIFDFMKDLMEWLGQFLDIVLHIDIHLNGVIQSYGLWTYLMLFIIIFCETGLVITPFLPGDSLLFAAGALSATGPLNPWILFVVLLAAAILGDSINYSIGHYMGPAIFERQHLRFIKRDYLLRTHAFYEKHGGKTIVIARFLPIIRTFAPFVAGIAKMSRKQFLFYNVSGAMLWVACFIGSGFYFGNIPIVKDNFTFVILMIIAISLLPGILRYLYYRLKNR